MRGAAHGRRGLGRATLLAAGVLACAVVACNRGPADEAVRAVEQALATTPELAAEAPEELAAITRELEQARSSLAAGRYTEALRKAQSLPDRIAAARALAAQRKAASAAAFEALVRELPPRLDALTARLALLVSGGWISSERQTAAQAELAALGEAWSEARAEFDAGKAAQALAAGESVKARAASLGRSLGLKPLSSTVRARPGETP